MVEARELDQADKPDLCLTKADLRDLVSHKDDPVVISVVTADKPDLSSLPQGPSWSGELSWRDVLGDFQQITVVIRPTWTIRWLFGLARDQVEVRGYVELRTTFSDDTSSSTVNIMYLVVKAPSAYNILLGRPAWTG